MKPQRFIWAALAVIALGLAGCQTIRAKLSQLDGAEAAKAKEIATLRADFDAKLAANAAALNEAHAKQVAALQAQIRGGSNSFYAIDQVYRVIPTPVRTDILWHNYALEGWASLGSLTPDYETMKAINDRLAKELDATKTSLADLQKTHQATVEQNQKVSDAAVAAAAVIAKLETERNQLNEQYRKQLDSLQAQLNELTQQKAALEKQRSDEAAARHAALAKLSWGAGIIAVLCIAGAIYSPVGKTELGWGAVVFGGAAVAIPFIEGWMILAAVGIAAAVLVARNLMQHHATDKTVVALTGYLHEKGQLAEADLQAWLTRYAKNADGTITTVPDKAVQAVIDQKLIATDRK